MIGIANIRKIKGLDNINDAYGIKEKPVSETKPAVPKPLNKPKYKKPVPKRSAKMKVVMRELKKMYPIFLKAHPFCEIQGPECKREATCIHHSEGRGKMQITKQSSWIPSCGPCNEWVERDDATARKLGLKKSKF